jgi:succinate-semialdehyde dehydrogenase/glutarate-semialdehyde dehydrogenase
MTYISLNPATGKILKTFPVWDGARLEDALEKAFRAQAAWRRTGFEQRARVFTRAASILRGERDDYAALITREMGKPLAEARVEVEKCAMACDYYALSAARFLADEAVETDASRSYVTYEPLGTVLAVMPWNFPFWQVFRAAVPALAAGNAVVLKHASNVPRCALALEEIFRQSGLPAHLFTTLLIKADQVARVIADPRVHGVTLTGSEVAGQAVAAEAGRNLKKCVLELGGSDAFVVLRDADLEYTADMAVAGRFFNCGQSCISAKRLVLVPEIAEAFLDLFKEKVAALKVGDPMDEATQVGPMARLDLRQQLHLQVEDALRHGAGPVLGCRPMKGAGAFYEPSILDHVTPRACAYHEELFGPVASVIRAQDEQDAIRIANDSKYGLGATLWSLDQERAERLALDIQVGCCFVNGVAKSDPRLPFGGVKASGFGRELPHHGIREFVNAKAVWVR